MPADFRSAIGKLQRGDQHAMALKREFAKWEASDPYDIALEHDLYFQRWTIRLLIRERPPLERWGLMVGDVVACYRSALDHALYALAAHETGEDPPPGERVLQFPICDSFKWYAAHKNRRLSDLSPRVCAVLQTFQPYLRRKDQPFKELSVLRELNDRDKHRAVHLAVHVLEGIHVKLDPPGHGALWGITSLGALEHEAVVARLYFSVPQDPEMTVNPEATFLISLELPNGEHRNVGSTFDEVRGAVRQIVGTLQRFGY